jgi:alpha-D-ribose 1-methylphosphonate 5-triphosphate synthase subunit PhnH
LQVIRETGFDDVFDSQAVFRALLDALSRPGATAVLPALDYPRAPAGFCRPALSVLKTLCDHRVSFSIGSSVRTPEWVRYMEVNLATRHESVEKAAYVLFDGRTYDHDFLRMNRGLPEFPEAGATALLCVDWLAEGRVESGSPSLHLGLSGPGVHGRALLTAGGLDSRYQEARASANRFYPMGIDVFLVDPDGRLAGIPRTTVVEAA